MDKSRHSQSTRVLTATAQDRDARYFLEHPSAPSYVRPATRGELRATGLPPGTQVYVALIRPGTRVRSFLPPDGRRN